MGRNHPQHKRTKRSSENTTRRRQGSIEQETANPPPQSPPIQQPRHSQDQQPRHSQDQDEVPRTSRSQAARLSEQVEANRLSQIAEEAKSQPVKLTPVPPQVPKPKRSELDWEKKDSLGKSPSADNLHRESNAPLPEHVISMTSLRKLLSSASQQIKSSVTNFLSKTKSPNEEEDNLKDGYSDELIIKPKKRANNQTEEDDDAQESRNVWSIEAFEPTADRKYATKLAKAITPFMRVAAIFGRFPLTYSSKKDGNIIFKFNYFSFPAIMFMIVGILTLMLFVLIFFNIVGLMMNKPAPPDVGLKRSRLIRSEEIAVMKRNLVPLIIFLTNLIHLVLAQAAFFFKREYIARYFGYWGEVVELLRLDVANQLKSELTKQMAIVIFMFLLLLGFHFSDSFSATNGGAAAVGILMTRCFNTTVHLKEDFYKYRYVGGFVFSYIYVSSKFYMLYFFFRCRLLKNLFVVWNRRFNICVNGAPGNARKMVRSTRAYLFKDHIVTLNLIEGANHEFVLILESYLLCAMVAMVVELYHLVRAVGGSEFDSNRQLDFIVLLCYLLFDFYIFFTASLEGGYIPEQAKVAFDIVKRKGMMTNRADQELWFMLSMRISFGGCSGVQGIGITAGDFVYITKTFILLAIGAMTSHFIIIYQFEMPLEQTSISDPNFRDINMTEVLARVEGARKWVNISIV